MLPFSTIPVPVGAAQNIEQLGTRPKFWFRQPELGQCLCKLTRPNTGEDWSEKIAAEIAELLGLPHALYELGDYQGQSCVVSPNFVPERCTLIHGNELLGRTDPSYGKMNVSRFRERAHTLEAVWDVLEQTDCELPLNWNPSVEIRLPGELFVGYLLLDAVVGNTDRHHENWAIVEAPDEALARRHLAPTFDHASCLGCHLTDSNRQSRLSTTDFGFAAKAFADKARSAFFPDDNTAQRPMLTMQAFQRGAERWPRAALAWMERLRAVPMERMNALFDRLPPERCSSISASFARCVLMHNVNVVKAMAANQ